MEKCGVCGETVEQACSDTVCEPEIQVSNKPISISQMVTEKLKAHFGVTEVDASFVDQLVSEIIRQDQIGRMGAIINYLQTEKNI